MRTLLLALLLAGCATTEPPPAPTVEQVPTNPPLQRLIRDTLQVDRAKAGIEIMAKEKSLTGPQARELRLLATMADEAVQGARNTYFVGDLQAFERSMITVGDLLHELRGRFSDIESERKQAAAERAYSRAQKKEKPK